MHLRSSLRVPWSNRIPISEYVKNPSAYGFVVAISPDEARALALSLPEAVEQDHHGRPSFRVGGKIFATLWTEQRLNVMLDQGGVHTAVESAPAACEEVYWGKRLVTGR